MNDLVEVDKSLVTSPLFKSRQLNLVNHVCDRALPAVVVHNKAGSTPLDSFNLPDVVFSEGIPNRTTILNVRSSQTFVGLDFNIAGGFTDITADKADHAICF